MAGLPLESGLDVQGHLEKVAQRGLKLGSIQPADPAPAQKGDPLPIEFDEGLTQLCHEVIEILSSRARFVFRGHFAGFNPVQYRDPLLEAGGIGQFEIEIEEVEVSLGYVIVMEFVAMILEEPFDVGNL